MEHILTDARRAGAFVQDLLRVTRSSTAGDRTGPVSLPAVVESALMAAGPLLRDQKVIASVAFDVADHDTALIGSGGALERAVLNIIVNAIQAMAGQVEEKTIRLEVSGGGARGELSLLVTDNGPGFTNTSASRAFERFFTTKPPGKGTGLGLWIVRETVAQFGGTVDIQATTGRGARIRLLFPVLRVADKNGETAGGGVRLTQLASAAG